MPLSKKNIFWTRDNQAKMHNLCRIGCYALETSRVSLICSSSVRCNSKKTFTVEDVNNSNSQNSPKKRKDKKIKYKRCSQSEPRSHRNLGDTPLILTALNAVDVVDSGRKSPLRRQRQKQVSKSILETANFASTRSQLIPSTNKRQSDSTYRHLEKGQENLNPTATDQSESRVSKRSYIINVFLNEPESKERANDCLNIHINDIDVTSDDVSMQKLTENIHKNCTEIDQILKDNLNPNDRKDQLTKELKRVWSDVFRQSKVEDFQLAKQQTNLVEDGAAKDDAEVVKLVSSVAEDVDPKKDDGSGIRAMPDETPNEGYLVDPAVAAARIDEIIKKNGLYKKCRNRRNAKLFLETEKGTKPVEESKIVQEVVERIQAKPDVKLRMSKIEDDRITIASTPIKENVIQEQNKMKDAIATDSIKEVELPQDPKPESQETFDTDPISNEIEKSMLVKSMTEEQMNKNKLSVIKQEPLPLKETRPKSRKFVKPRKRERIEVVSLENDKPSLPETRPVPLTHGNRLKYYNQRTQRQIEDIIKMSSLPTESQNTIKKVLTYCKDLLKEGQLSSRLSKFLQQDDFDTKKPYTPRKSYASIIRSKLNDDNEKELSKNSETKPMVSNEEVFGTQQAFQQKCGVRERIMPTPQSNHYRPGQRRLSYSRASLIDSKLHGKRLSTISLNRVVCNRSYSTKQGESSKKGSGSKIEEDSDCKTEEDAGSKTEEETELKPCDSSSCRSEEDETNDEVNKCEKPEMIKQISEGVLGCTSKCLVNRVPNEPAEPELLSQPCKINNSDPRCKQEVDAVEPKCDIMDEIGQFVDNEKDFNQIENYYGDNGYKNLEYFKYYRTSFYDINDYLSKKRNAQPDPYAHKKSKIEKKDNTCNF
ncbi:hypothetical protein Trydic_g10140 [Trypoxylus dichotomus]